MQITQTESQGLKRQFKVILAAADLAKRLEGELVTLGQTAKLPGFRPGKVPKEHLRRLYGKSVMADVVQNVVNEANRKIVDDNGLKLAMEPSVNFPQERETIDAVMEARGDLEYTVAVEVLPSIQIADHSDITLEKQVVEVADSEVDAALTRMAEPSRPYVAKDDKAKAASGDRVTVDFVGRIGGVPFEGGTGADIQVVLGSNTFIPGFEDQLIGIAAGETRLVKVTFPQNYAAAQLAGQEAEFDVTAKIIEAPGDVVIDDALAKQYGMEDLAKLKEAVKGSISNEYAANARRKMKRKLLDALDEKYTFDLPPTLLEQEFNAIWNNVGMEMKAAGKTFEDEGTTEAAARADYEKIAARRVRLGLVLAEIGEKAGVQVTDEEVSQGLVQRARQFPGQEKQVWEYYRKNPQALAEIRAPIFEEKVVDHVLSQVKTVETTVTREVLMSDEDEAGDTGADAKPKKAPTKAAAKKTKKSED